LKLETRNLKLIPVFDAARIAELLRPFLEDTPPQLAEQLLTYLDLLLRWNARMNLTAIRDPEQIVTRHFGESLFAGRVLRDAGALSGTPTLSDIGSGAGFPGIPIKLLLPDVRLTLIESQNKKATFLREVIRALNLPDAEVFNGRAESWGGMTQVVSLRAVEKFESVVPTAASLVAPSGYLMLLISQAQLPVVVDLLGSDWEPVRSELISGSGSRLVWLAQTRH
jgi:16S rRNA (guanine527-N7)-methyltransferase